MTALDSVLDKIKNWKTAASVVRRWKDLGDEIVFTNGCFDLIHFGHLHYLAKAKELGQRLVIGLNSDASVSRLKGEHRPIKDLNSRQMQLAALEFVDLVVVFEEDTPKELIECLLPDILVKGGDYDPEDIVGYETVLENGGAVRTLNFIEGYSTTAFETKIKAARL
ncbi:MAG: D-glycero-beta-D-manno-heptose 1-phosphate adenylyltransferase [Saprospiraceae bacterium]|nr:D-glycero-beta-D-manno-heptose 1-phosphate adenylyltransferase [Saprospiraceae bacterium]